MNWLRWRVLLFGQQMPSYDRPKIRPHLRWDEHPYVPACAGFLEGSCGYLGFLRVGTFCENFMRQFWACYQHAQLALGSFGRHLSAWDGLARQAHGTALCMGWFGFMIYPYMTSKFDPNKSYNSGNLRNFLTEGSFEVELPTFGQMQQQWCEQSGKRNSQ